MDFYDILFARRMGGGSSIPVPVTISNGGTGATTAADARTNLGVYSETEVDLLLEGKADTSDIPTDLNQLSNTTTKYVNETQLQNAIDSLGSVFTLKGSVSTVNDLPNTGNTVGDVYYVESVSGGYVWINDNGTLRWEALGNTTDTSDFLTKSGLLTTTGNATNNTMTQAAITTALNGKANTNDIPTSTSDLINDSNFIASTALSAVATSGSYTDLSNKPTQLTDFSGTLPVTQGGTGATSLASGEILLGNGTSAITSVSTLPISKGGTGGTTSAAARTNLELYSTSEIDTLLNGKADTTDIPTKTSDLINDSNFIASTALSAVATSGSYTDLSNKPTQLTDFSGTLPITQGGTGGATATAARTNLGVMTGTSLWGNSSGTRSTITLNDNYTNYDFIFIQGRDNGVATCNIFRPITTDEVSICNWYSSATSSPSGMYYHGCILSFSGTTVTFQRNGTYYLKMAANTADTWTPASSDGGIWLTKIIGYKY